MALISTSDNSLEAEWVLAEDVDAVVDGTQAAPHLRVEGVLEYPTVSDGQCKLYGVLSVIAPTPLDETRAPLRLVAVLDKSGSMRGNKLDLVKKTMLYMMRHLSEKDALGIVEYDTTANVLCPLTRCDAPGRARLEASLRRLQDGSQTNLSGGLLKGLELHGTGLSTGVLLPSEQEQHVFLDAAKNGNWDRVELLVTENPLLINCQPSGRWSALHQAVYAGAKAAVEFLLAHGALASATTKDGQVPTELTNSEEILAMLGAARNGCRSAGSQENLASSSICNGGYPDSSSKCADTPSAAVEGVVRSTFLFTDGLANVGITSHDTLVAATKSALGELGESKSTLSTFGFGKDHSAELLKNLANIEGFQGVYNYVENEDSIGLAFGEALGGLLTTTHQNVQLKLELGEGVKLAEVLTTYTVEGPKEGAERQEVLVQVGDLFAEERRDILLELELPPGTESLTCGRVSARGFSVLETRYEDTTIAEMVVERDSDEAKAEQHPQVVRHRNRHVMTKALEAARQCAANGDFNAAQERIDAAVEVINMSPLKDEVCQGLLTDLKICRAGLIDQKRYQEQGRHRMLNLECTHTRQRACNTAAWGSSDLYCNNRSRLMRADFGEEMSRR